jgi:hypothetical protein
LTESICSGSEDLAFFSGGFDRGIRGFDFLMRTFSAVTTFRCRSTSKRDPMLHVTGAVPDGSREAKSACETKVHHEPE